MPRLVLLLLLLPLLLLLLPLAALALPAAPADARTLDDTLTDCASRGFGDC